MRALCLVLLMISTCAAGQQAPCELVAQTQWPNCHFTQRSGGFNLLGPVQSVLGTYRDLAPDPRARGKTNPKPPKLFISSSPTYVAFNLAGEVIENAGTVSANGKPLNVYRETSRIEGSTRIVTGGTEEAPDSFRTEQKRDANGRVVEQLVYQQGTLISRMEQIYDQAGNEVEDRSYDGHGELTFRGVLEHDRQGRTVGVKHFDHGRLVYDMRDVYEGKGDDDRDLVSRAWYDENGTMIRQIALREGQVSWWWQQPNCGDRCQTPENIGLNFVFDYGNNFELQPDGSLLTTIEHHKERYGNIDNDDAELYDQRGNLIEKIAYRYVRDSHGNWTERVASVLDPSTGQMVDVRIDTRQLTYY